MKKTILHMDSNPNSMPRKKKKVKRGFHITAVLLLLIIFAVYFLFPFVWMLSVSLQTESELMVSSGLGSINTERMAMEELHRCLSTDSLFKVFL